AIWYGRGNNDAREAVDPPKSFTVGGIVSGQFEGAGHQELLATTGRPDHRRGVAAEGIWPGRLPNGLSRSRIERHQKTVDVVVFTENHLAVDQHGRTARAVFVAKRAEGVLPKLPPVKVVTNQSATAEENKQPFAITRRRRRGGTAHRRMDFFNAFRGGFLL